MRIASWNVNSVRQRSDHIARLAESHAPDVLCLQETKVRDEDFPAETLKQLGYTHQAIHGQKGYNGVAILSRLPFRESRSDIWCGKDDKRHACAIFENGLELHNFYVPSGGPTPDPEANDKFAHKLRFLDEMADWAALRSGTAQRDCVLLVGDMNVAPLETDVWNHKRLVRSVGHTPTESGKIARLLEAGKLTDVARHFVPPEQPLYSWWGYRFPQSFEKNYGWRLDHAWASPGLLPEISGLQIYKDSRTWEKPSDHTPVIVDLE
ncbi:MAG: exodeoxyribonuclease III [Rhodovibrionaceae bacterium]